jgi:hypothetical protein
MTNKPYVFGIGLNKTGTRSLHDALATLGYTPLHWGGPASRIAVEQAEAEGAPLLTHLQGYDAFSDILALATRFDVLDAQYPDSRFILTTRPIDRWVESRRRHVERNQAEAAAGRYDGTFLDIEPDAWRAEYETHHHRVLAHFADRPDDLLVLDIERDSHQGWELLCPFLDEPVPDQPFPWQGRDTTSAT